MKIKSTLFLIVVALGFLSPAHAQVKTCVTRQAAWQAFKALHPDLPYDSNVDPLNNEVFDWGGETFTVYFLCQQLEDARYNGSCFDSYDYTSEIRKSDCTEVSFEKDND